MSQQNYWDFQSFDPSLEKGLEFEIQVSKRDFECLDPSLDKRIGILNVLIPVSKKKFYIPVLKKGLGFSILDLSLKKRIMILKVSILSQGLGSNL